MQVAVELLRFGFRERGIWGEFPFVGLDDPGEIAASVLGWTTCEL